MMAADKGLASAGERKAPAPPTGDAAVRPQPPTPFAGKKTSQPVALRPAGTLFAPQGSLVWTIGLLGLGACVVPWFTRGWLWLGLISVPVALLAMLDAAALWFTRQEYLPVLLQKEKGLRGAEGQAIEVPLALTSSGRRFLVNDIRVALMPATRESESAFRIRTNPQRLKLEPGESANGESTPAKAAHIFLWPWMAELALVRRGVWPGPRAGIERRSYLRFWRLRRWFDMTEDVRIDANLQAGRQEILRSPVYRMLVAAQQTPWTGHGREFERLREYQPGDNYTEIAWKSTARRSVPVTRLFQWEQKQEVYFVVDQSRTSALTVDPPASDTTGERTRRRMLDLSVETALVGATVALELGDEFGLVTYADGAKSWLRAGSGKSQFHRFRDCLLHTEPLPTTADYEVLFGELRVRLRRRAYLVVLADLTERSITDQLRRGVGLVCSSHALLMTSILPSHARPAFSATDADLTSDQDVYAALAGDRENQRLGALSRQLRQLNVQLRYIPAERFLRTAVEGYMENKREQRL